MRCPFLKEAEVRFCGISPFRKMLLNTGCCQDEEKCTSGKFLSCSLAAGRAEIQPEASSCPFFCKSLAQFCAAAPATHFIPYSEDLLSCCQSSGHRYCDLFLTQTDPEHAAGSHALGAPQVNGIDLPFDLAFSPNHMWLDRSEDGSCHLGVDAFLAKVIGKVEKVSFVIPGNICRPTAVLRVCGVDLRIAFPMRVNINRSNIQLRRDADRIVSDPYGRGWLFEGQVPADAAAEMKDRAFVHLFRGEDARAWMKRETERMMGFLREIRLQSVPEGQRLFNDGGTFDAPILPHLASEDRTFLFDTFFPFDSRWRSL